MEPVKVVIRYLDGRVTKGFTKDFNPGKTAFRLYADPAAASGTPVNVQMKDLKAIFFVKTFEGDSGYQERKTLRQEDQPPGRKVEVVFKDGEVMQGSVLGYSPERPGFFFFPADPQGNNSRVFVLKASLSKFRYI